MSRDARERRQDIREALTAISVYVGGSLDAPSINDAMVLDAVLFAADGHRRGRQER